MESKTHYPGLATRNLTSCVFILYMSLATLFQMVDEHNWAKKAKVHNQQKETRTSLKALFTLCKTLSKAYRRLKKSHNTIASYLVMAMIINDIHVSLVVPIAPADLRKLSIAL